MLRSAVAAAPTRAFSTPVAGTAAPTTTPVAPAATRQVRFAHGGDYPSSMEPQVEGGLRGVVGTLSLVERDAVYVEAWVPEGPDTLRCGDAWAARDAELFAGVRKVCDRHCCRRGKDGKYL